MGSSPVSRRSTSRSPSRPECPRRPSSPGTPWSTSPPRTRRGPGSSCSRCTATLACRPAPSTISRARARSRARRCGAIPAWAASQARREGTILLGGDRLRGGVFDRGHFVAPTVARLPLSSTLFLEELFVPLLAVGEVTELDQAIAETNKAQYGLTAGIFSKKPEEIEHFFDEVEAGVCYVNKRTGATTGAWPGAQAFTGWKGSGSTGKGGCGPYYVAQFLREQSRTVIEEAR